MSREMKFRAWFDPELWGDEDEWSGMVEDFQDDIIFSGIGFDSPDVPVMQYTGLKDKNGVEIYEGDIVYIAGTGRYKIAWDKDQAGFETDCIEKHGLESFMFQNFFEYLEGKALDWEVIGNIYQNPELLENK